jgi:hypothetical protein
LTAGLGAAGAGFFGGSTAEARRLNEAKDNATRVTAKYLRAVRGWVKIIYVS